jgi:hypothetical protein
MMVRKGGDPHSFPTPVGPGGASAGRMFQWLNHGRSLDRLEKRAVLKDADQLFAHRPDPKLEVFKSGVRWASSDGFRTPSSLGSARSCSPAAQDSPLENVA